MSTIKHIDHTLAASCSNAIATQLPPLTNIALSILKRKASHDDENPSVFRPKLESLPTSKPTPINLPQWEETPRGQKVEKFKSDICNLPEHLQEYVPSELYNNWKSQIDTERQNRSYKDFQTFHNAMLNQALSYIPKFQEHPLLQKATMHFKNRAVDIWNESDSLLNKLVKIYYLGDLLKKVHEDLCSDIKLDSVLDTYFIMQQDKSGLITVPSAYGMALLLAYYEVKYDIELHIGTTTECKRLIEQQPIDRPFGIILLPDCIKEDDFKNLDSAKGPGFHVTPLIISKTQTTTQVCVLDSVNTRNIYNKQFDTTANTTTTIRPKADRQADGFSCRNDAINILSNALWDLKQNHINDLSIYDEKLPPCAWCKTFQKSLNLPQDSTGSVRTKKDDKSLDVFLKTHSDKNGIRRYLLNKGHKYGARIQDLIFNKDHYPQSLFTRYETKLERLKDQGFQIDLNFLS